MSAHEIIFTFVSSFMALFPVINPIGSGFIVNGFLEGLDNVQRKAVIKKIMINCLVIGIGSLIAGHFILQLFNLAIPVVQLGGGILICKTGLEWLSGTETTSPNDNNNEKQETINKIDIEDIESKLFYPISFPISIGPGSISVIFTLVASGTIKGSLLKSTVNYSLIALVIISLLAILYVFLSQGQKITKKFGTSGNTIINKMVAFFTFCIGIQITVTGIAKIFHLNIL